MQARQFRRLVNRLFVDRPESALRRFSGRSHWPPLSLRRWVGSRGDFDADGRWLIDQLSIRELLSAGARVLDVGCGCGRLAMALARDPRVAPLGVTYHGLDVDQPSIEWCRRRIASEHDGFDFEHISLRNRSYNPSGPLDAATYRFPFADVSCGLVVAASLFTHLVASEMEHYLSEMARLLAGSGTLWATFFLFGNPAAPPGRHPVDFPARDGKVAYHSQREPEKAVSFAESYILEVAAASGLELAEPIAYGPHDHLFFRPAGSAAAGRPLRS